MISELKDKNADVEKIAKKAIKNGKLIPELIENLKIKDETIRHNSHKTLVIVTEQKPELVYRYWNFLEDMLEGKNTYWRLSAAKIISNLTLADVENKFDRIFDEYYDLLNDSIIIAANITAYSGKIAKAKPHLEDKITNILLKIDKTEQKHKGLMSAGVIDTFDKIFKESKNKKKILKFVKKQLNCDSPKTRKIAEEFLKKWET